MENTDSINNPAVDVPSADNENISDDPALDLSEQENENASDDKKEDTSSDDISGQSDTAAVKKTSGKVPISVWMPVAVIAAVFLVVAYYLLFPSKGYFHSDCTDTMVWAAASYESGHIFDPECNYACLLPFGGSLLMLPFYGMFGFSMTTHLIGMFLFMIIFSASLLFMLKQMKWSLPWIAVMYSAVMLMVSVSDKLREIFWGHTIYYSLGILFIFVGLGMYFKIRNYYEADRLSNEPKNKNNIIFLLAVLFVWFFLCATNKLMTVTIFSLPVIGAIFLERFLDFDKKIKENVFYGIVLLLAAAATIAGYNVSTLIAGDIVGGYADAYSNFSAPDTWIDNLLKFPLAWFTLLGVDVKDRDPIMDFDGVLNLIKIISALLLVVVPIIAACFYKKIKDGFTRIIIIVHFLVTALVMMGFVFGMLSAANWRLSPIVCTSVMATVVFCKWIYDNETSRRLGGLLIVPNMLVCLIAVWSICSMPHDYGQDEGLYAVSDFLMENDLDYGYATFWNANAVTAVSNDKVKVRCINDIGEGPLGVNLYQSRKSWYIPDAGQEKFFLLLTEGEMNILKENNNKVLERDHTVLKFNEYTILVFYENIFHVQVID